MGSHWRSKGLSPDVPQYYIRRALFKSMGYTDQDLEKPLVAIANTWNEILPGSYHWDRIARAKPLQSSATGTSSTSTSRGAV